MILRYLALVCFSYAQFTPQPVLTTGSACLNGCLEDKSFVFAANNLRNFEKIIVNVDQFCRANEQLIRCSESCSEDDQIELSKKTVLSEYICKEKIEEFRLVKDCIQSQETDSVNQCSSDCGHPADANIQLDSSPSAVVNPFAFFDSITPVCRTIECIMKCSIAESNKKCAGTGDIFRDLGFKQVYDASERLQGDLENSSSAVAGQLAKIYLKALPEQCAFIINPAKYDSLFADQGDDLGSEMPTEIASLDEITTTDKPQEENADDGTPAETADGTWIFVSEPGIVSTTALSTEFDEQKITSTASSIDSTTSEFFMEPVNEPDLPLGPPSNGPADLAAHELEDGIAQPEHPVQIQIQPVPSQSDVEHIPEQDEPLSSTTLTPDESEVTQTATEIPSAVTELNEDGQSKIAADVKEQTTPAGTDSGDPEKTIVVVNDDNEIQNNQVHNEVRSPYHRKANAGCYQTPALVPVVAIALSFLL